MKNSILAILSGSLLAISWPTYGFPLFLFIAFVPLLIAEYQIRNSDTKRKKLKVLGVSYISFLIFNIATTWWLYYATAFGMIFANFANAFLMSIVFLLYHVIAVKTSQKLSLISLICLWICFEKFHLNWELSWPWLNLGNGFADFHKWIQWYEYTGVFGGTLWVWLVNILLFKAIISYRNNKEKTHLIKQLIAAFSIVVIGIFTSLYIYTTTETSKEKVNVIVLQPNIDPYKEKYNTSNEVMANLLVEIAKEKMDSTVSFVIAPETTLPDAVHIKGFEKQHEYRILKKFVDETQTTFVSGITFANSHSPSEKPNKTARFFNNDKNGRWYNLYNSAFCIQKEQDVKIYHKSKLVVGVEHTPYKNILGPLLDNSMIDLGGQLASLTTQKERTVFSNGKNYLAPIICYESVYGEYVTKYVHKGADFLAIITNDGWWNNTQGHKQHLSMARLRAIETRRSVARSANTGISAIINQKGDIEQSLGYEKRGCLKGAVSTSHDITFYTRHGDYIYRISLLTLIIIVFASFTRRRKG